MKSEPALKKVEIPLIIVGCDFRIASSSLRQMLISTKDDRKELFTSIQNLDPTAGLLVLETCNRIEWIVSSETPDWIAEILVAWMQNHWNHNTSQKNHITPYIHIGEDAVTHLLRVVVGMESLAAGEAQIAGQFHSALNTAQKEKTSTPLLNRLGHIAGRIAKSGYKIGFRSNFRQGIHGLVGKFIGEYHSKESDIKTILVAGMGEIGRKTAELLEETSSCRLIRFNRTIKPEHKRLWKSLDTLKDHTEQADALIVATGSPVPVIGSNHIRLKNRKRKLLIMDIGIPLQVESFKTKHTAIDYRTIDDLVDLVGNHDQEKNKYKATVDIEINRELQRFKRFCWERGLSLLLEKIHQNRLMLTQKTIPEFISKELQEVSNVKRKKIESTIIRFIQTYSNDIFNSFHQTLEKYWGINDCSE